MSGRPRKPRPITLAQPWRRREMDVDLCVFCGTKLKPTRAWFRAITKCLKQFKATMRKHDSTYTDSFLIFASNHDITQGIDLPHRRRRRGPYKRRRR